MKRLLITGASGFIGQHFLSLLSESDYEVHAIDLKSLKETYPHVVWHQADLLNSAQTWELISRIRPTHLLHLAWITTPGKWASSPDNLRWVQGGIDLINAFREYGGKRVVGAGSCAEYDWKYGYCSEDTTPLAPATLYGACKHALHIVLAAFAAQTGLSAAWGRIFFVYGPYENSDRLIPYVINSLLKNELVRCSHGNQIRDFLYVGDVAQALFELLKNEISGPVNIASGKPIVLKEMIYMIAEKLDRENLIALGAIPAAENEPPLLLADVHRLTHEIEWSPRFTLDEGLDLTINWWKNNPKIYNDSFPKFIKCSE